MTPLNQEQRDLLTANLPALIAELNDLYEDLRLANTQEAKDAIQDEIEKAGALIRELKS